MQARKLRNGSLLTVHPDTADNVSGSTADRLRLQSWCYSMPYAANRNQAFRVRGVVPLHRVRAQIRVDPGEIAIDLVRDRHRTAQSPCAPNNLSGSFHECRHV
jgi:hypothetical protein